MYRFSAVAALLLLSVAPLWADSPTVDDGASPLPWYKRVFTSVPAKPEPAAEPPAPKPITPKDVSRSLEQEQKVYLERLQFCTRLRQIAVETNDNGLMFKADDLEKRASDIYMKRTDPLHDRLEEAKAAEAALGQKNESKPAGTASANHTVSGHYPNGKPIINQE